MFLQSAPQSNPSHTNTQFSIDALYRANTTIWTCLHPPFLVQLVQFIMPGPWPFAWVLSVFNLALLCIRRNFHFVHRGPVKSVLSSSTWPYISRTRISLSPLGSSPLAMAFVRIVRSPHSSTIHFVHQFHRCPRTLCASQECLSHSPIRWTYQRSTWNCLRALAPLNVSSSMDGTSYDIPF